MATPHPASHSPALQPLPSPSPLPSPRQGSNTTSQSTAVRFADDPSHGLPPFDAPTLDSGFRNVALHGNPAQATAPPRPLSTAYSPPPYSPPEVQESGVVTRDTDQSARGRKPDLRLDIPAQPSLESLRDDGDLEKGVRRPVLAVNGGVLVVDKKKKKRGCTRWWCCVLLFVLTLLVIAAIVGIVVSVYVQRGNRW